LLLVHSWRWRKPARLLRRVERWLRDGLIHKRLWRAWNGGLPLR
jgi:hypothetical protein